jgi:ubiquinone/menaquinone biosynthesis C-methylase UbiE
LIQGKILDLGCGDGIFGNAAGLSDSACGIDYDRDSLHVRRRILPTAQSIWGDASQMPFENASFDTVVSNSVLEHLSNLQATFHEVFRVLKPGGRFLFTITMGGFSKHILTLGGPSDAKRLLLLFGHLQEPTNAEVEDQLSLAGFHVDELFEYQPIYFTRVYRFLQSPVIQFIERRLPSPLRSRFLERLSKASASSLLHCPPNEGACIWVTATKPLS